MHRIVIVFVFVSTFALAVAARPAAAQHADILFSVEGGTIVTAAETPEGKEPDRVFAAEFGEGGCDPFTEDPGLEAEPGTFPAGTQLGFDALEGWRAWNGDGFEPAGGEYLLVSFGAQSFTVADGPAAGFGLFVDGDGGLHKHLDFCQNGCAAGCAPPGADAGVYLLCLQAWTTAPGVDPSPAFYVVFDYGAGEAAHDAAVEWVRRNLLARPCPADVDGDGAVGFPDLTLLLASWGACVLCPADLNGDGLVGFEDLVALLGAWGGCG